MTTSSQVSIIDMWRLPSRGLVAFSYMIPGWQSDNPNDVVIEWEPGEPIPLVVYELPQPYRRCVLLHMARPLPPSRWNPANGIYEPHEYLNQRKANASCAP